MNKINYILHPPNKSKCWIVVPIAYLILLQLLTGIPQPESLKELRVDNLLLSFSEEIFSYPFWLQDLSHLPLFFTFAWLWAWYLGPVKLSKILIKNICFHICWLYACINELSQFLVPMRFPSIGDLLMNLLGILIGLTLHQFLASPKVNHYFATKT